MDSKMIKKERAAAGLALAEAEYQLRPTAWFKGKERTRTELQEMAGSKLFPLPPWTYAGWTRDKSKANDPLKDWAARANF